MIHSLPHDHGSFHEQIQAEMPGWGSFEAASEVFKILGDSKRIQIFWLLCHCEECVINISALLDMNTSTVSHHLKLMKNGGLLVSRREGKEVIYTVAKTLRTHVLHDMLEQIIESSCPVREVIPDNGGYDSRLRVINEVHDLITGDLRTHYTIDELSRKFHINSTTLKIEFKRVFGRPIASYMKDYRIKKAMELLQSTDRSVGVIAGDVGYGNQSKFTEAFKAVSGLIPREYRRLHKQRA